MSQSNDSSESSDPIYEEIKDLTPDEEKARAEKLAAELAAERRKPSIGRIQDESIRKSLEEGIYSKDLSAAKNFAKYVAGLKKDPVNEIKRDKDGNITEGVYELVDGKYRIDQQQAIKAGLDGEMYVNRLDANGKAILDLDGNPVVDVIILEKGVITNVIKGAPEDPKNPNLGTCSIADETMNKAIEYQKNLAKSAGISSATEQSTTTELPRAKTITDPNSVDTINNALIDEQGTDANDATGKAFRETVDKAVGIGEGIKLVPVDGKPGQFKLEIPTDFNGVAVVPHLDEHGKPKPGDDRVDVLSIENGVIKNGLITEGSSLDDSTKRSVAEGAARNLGIVDELEIERRANIASGRDLAAQESIYSEVDHHGPMQPTYEEPVRNNPEYAASSVNNDPTYDNLPEGSNRGENSEGFYDNVRTRTEESNPLAAALAIANNDGSNPAVDLAVRGGADLDPPNPSRGTYDIASPDPALEEPIYDVARSGDDREKNPGEKDTEKKDKDAERNVDEINNITQNEISPDTATDMTHYDKLADLAGRRKGATAEAEREQQQDPAQEPIYDRANSEPDKAVLHQIGQNTLSIDEQAKMAVAGQGVVAESHAANVLGTEVGGASILVTPTRADGSPFPPDVVEKAEEVRNHAEDPQVVRSTKEVQEEYNRNRPPAPEREKTSAKNAVKATDKDQEATPAQPARSSLPNVNKPQPSGHGL